LAKTPARLRTRVGAAQNHAPLDTPEAKRSRKATVNRTFTILRAALNKAWREGKVPSNRAWSMVERFKGVDAARIRYLTVAEAQRLINASEGAFRTLVQAALQTGCRYGELAALRVHDFNPDSGTLAIATSKSGKPRHAVLTEEGQRFFAELCAGRAGDAAMLVKANGEAWRKSQQCEPMRLACERAKISPPIEFHGLRHTWASLAVMNGTPLMVVAKNLGHRDTKMCEAHYSHLAPSYIADEIRARAPRFGFEASGKVAALR
jgi:integrase